MIVLFNDSKFDDENIAINLYSFNLI